MHKKRDGEMTQWEKSDWGYMITFFVLITILSLLGANDTIPREVALIGFAILAVLAMNKPLFQGLMVSTINKTFGKGTDDYWREINDIIMNTSNKQSFHYNLNLPKEYMPQHQIELPELKLSLHEINKDELVLGFGEEYDTANGTDRPEYFTIIYNTQRQSIIGGHPKSIELTMKWLKENKEYYSKESSFGFIPQIIKETTLGKVQFK